MSSDEPTYTPTTLRLVSADIKKAGAAKERARIRRLIGPALRVLRGVQVAFDDVGRAIRAAHDIDAATRPEPKQKRVTP